MNEHHRLLVLCSLDLFSLESMNAFDVCFVPEFDRFEA